MTTNKDLFAKHVHLGTFLETGTCYGRSVEIALRLGFKDIRSVEGSQDRYNHCCEKFAVNENVILFRGESVKRLPEMIDVHPEPILFFLDSHPSGADSYGEETYKTNPEHEQSNILRAEMAIIKERNVKGDVILVDDLSDDIKVFALELFRGATIQIHSTDEGVNKVMEIVT